MDSSEEANGNEAGMGTKQEWKRSGNGNEARMDENELSFDVFFSISLRFTIGRRMKQFRWVFQPLRFECFRFEVQMQFRFECSGTLSSMKLLNSAVKDSSGRKSQLPQTSAKGSIGARCKFERELCKLRNYVIHRLHVNGSFWSVDEGNVSFHLRPSANRPREAGEIYFYFWYIAVSSKIGTKTVPFNWNLFKSSR